MVPAGEHVVEVRWQMTPLRLSMNLLSLFALGGVIIVSYSVGSWARQTSAYIRAKYR